MKTDGNYRMDLVLAGQIKRLPGLKCGASGKSIKKIREFAGKRGYYMPVVLSESDGCMTLLAGAATFKVCLEEKRAKIPAVIVKTESDADNLILSIQSAELNDSPGAIAVSAAIVQLIDTHGVSRKHIAESLGKSPAWVNKMEGLSRNLNETVQSLVAEGHISSRTAWEIARLPDNIQTRFAISAENEFLSKNNVAYLVNRYLNEDISPEERDRIIQTPKLALPNEWRGCRARAKDCSDSERLSRGVARCLDDAAYLSRLLDRIDMDATAIYMPDIAALAESLEALRIRVQAILYPGKKEADMGSGDGESVNYGGGDVDQR